MQLLAAESLYNAVLMPVALLIIRRRQRCATGHSRELRLIELGGAAPRLDGRRAWSPPLR